MLEEKFPLTVILNKELHDGLLAVDSGNMQSSITLLTNTNNTLFIYLLFILGNPLSKKLPLISQGSQLTCTL